VTVEAVRCDAAFAAVTAHLARGGAQRVSFCGFSEDDHARYQAMIDAI